VCAPTRRAMKANTTCALKQTRFTLSAAAQSVQLAVTWLNEIKETAVESWHHQQLGSHGAQEGHRVKSKEKSVDDAEGTRGKKRSGTSTRSCARVPLLHAHICPRANGRKIHTRVQRAGTSSLLGQDTRGAPTPWPAGGGAAHTPPNEWPRAGAAGGGHALAALGAVWGTAYLRVYNTREVCVVVVLFFGLGRALRSSLTETSVGSSHSVVVCSSAAPGGQHRACCTPP
jgi:hypothetical protein